MQRQAFVVRVEPDGSEITVEDVRAGRKARLPDLQAVGDQIAVWLREAQPLTDSAGASPQSCSNR